MRRQAQAKAAIGGISLLSANGRQTIPLHEMPDPQ